MENVFAGNLRRLRLTKNLTQEQAEAWSGNVTIKVLSQGIQAAGLDHATAMEKLGAVNQTNLINWFAKDNKAVINNIF